MDQHRPETFVRIDLTSDCFRVIERYARLRGMTPSQVMFLAVRFSLYKEALVRPEIRQMFEEEGIDFDKDAVAEWSSYLDKGSTLDEIFTPLPDEAFEGANSTVLMAFSLVSKYLFDPPKSFAHTVWRIVSSLLVVGCLFISYVVVFRADMIHAIITPEEIKKEGP